MTTPLTLIDKPLMGTRIWTADFIKLTIVTTLLRICTQVQITSMPLFFLHLGGSNALAGLSMTFFTLAALLMRPFIGLTLDTYGRKPIHPTMGRCRLYDLDSIIRLCCLHTCANLPTYPTRHIVLRKLDSDQYDGL